MVFSKNYSDIQDPRKTVERTVEIKNKNVYKCTAELLLAKRISVHKSQPVVLYKGTMQRSLGCLINLWGSLTHHKPRYFPEVFQECLWGMYTLYRLLTKDCFRICSLLHLAKHFIARTMIWMGPGITYASSRSLDTYMLPILQVFRM